MRTVGDICGGHCFSGDGECGSDGGMVDSKRLSTVRSCHILCPSFLFMAHCSCTASSSPRGSQPDHCDISKSGCGGFVPSGGSEFGNLDNMFEKEENLYLRVDSCLRIPVVALQHSRCCSPIHACETHELRDRILLLGVIGWRHVWSALVFEVVKRCAVDSSCATTAGLRSRS